MRDGNRGRSGTDSGVGWLVLWGFGTLQPGMQGCSIPISFGTSPEHQ